jgi:DNA-binding GntR family transcriptional regulator
MVEKNMPVKSKVMADDLVAVLKERIIRWEYPPQYRLIEEELCLEFQTSRSPVREALRHLAAQGFVIKAPYKGFSVAQPQLDELKELYSVRLVLEVFVVETLARRGLPTDTYQVLHETWSKVLQGETIESIASMDRRFHETLAGAIDNKILLRYLTDINDRIHISRMTDFTTQERIKQTSEQHLEILEHICDGDISASRQAIAENIQDGLKNIETTIDQARFISAVTLPKPEIQG